MSAKGVQVLYLTFQGAAPPSAPHQLRHWVCGHSVIRNEFS